MGAAGEGEWREVGVKRLSRIIMGIYRIWRRGCRIEVRVKQNTLRAGKRLTIMGIYQISVKDREVREVMEGVDIKGVWQQVLGKVSLPLLLQSQIDNLYSKETKDYINVPSQIF